MKRLLPVLALAAVPALARAANDSIVTLALGSHTVVGQSAAIVDGGAPSTSVGQGLGLRARLLYHFGAELSCELTSDGVRADRNVAPARFQVSALIYLVAKQRFSLYLVAGLGATEARHLFSLSAATSSYHGGAGIEIGMSKHWVLAAEWRTRFPAWAQIEPRRGDRPLGDFYNLDTWQVALGLRYYL